MSTDRSPSPPPGNLVERLYVLWVTSSLVLVLLAVVLALIGSGQLRRQARRISEQAEAIDALREELLLVRQELSGLEAAASRPLAPALSSRPSSAPVRESEVGPPASQADEASVDEPTINALLEDALRQGRDLPYEISDRAAAEDILRRARRNVGRAAWSGRTWARLAVLAGLLDQERSAEVFAHDAAKAGAIPDAYYELTARKLLRRGKVTDALVFAKRLAAAQPGDPRGVLLLAEVRRAQGNLGATAAALAGLQNVERLPTAAMLRLGRLLVALEDWDRLDALLGRIDQVPPELLQPLNGLRARLAIQRDRLPDALAILDNLRAECSAAGDDTLLLPLDEYDVCTWRGVALMEAGNFEAAREALAHVPEHPGRPEGWYWRGVLELRASDSEAAGEHLRRALEASGSYAPAWEALGAIALNQGQLATALLILSTAAELNPYRASTHFLTAVVHAKAGRAKETAESLRTALGLDPALMQTAQKTEAISRLFSDHELRELAGVDAADPADTPVETSPAEPE